MRQGRNPGMMVWLALACLLLAPARARAGEIIDRVVATVNREVVLESDLDMALRFQGLLAGRPPGKATAGQRAEELQRLIDQSLLRQQMGGVRVARATDKEIAAAVAELRAQVPGGETEEGWRSALAAAGITEHEAQQRLAAQIEISHFIERRFRPGTRIGSSEIRQYYDETFVPELRTKGVAPPPLAQVETKIQELLVEKTISEQLGLWLKTLRAESRIRLLVNPEDAARTT